MIKNQLYPYIEGYINDYLVGFSKEQLEVGLTSGKILLEKLTIRPDKANSKLDVKEMPFWLRFGTIERVNIGCSLMNFIGEKPLDIEIDSMKIVFGPSLKHFERNLNSFLVEKENNIKEQYDPQDNNSNDIFIQNFNLLLPINGQPKPHLSPFDDRKDKIAKILNILYTIGIKIFYQKGYLINLKMTNLLIIYEDDLILKDQKFILLLPTVTFSFSYDGSNKKNMMKMDNMSIYFEHNNKPVFPSEKFLEFYKDSQFNVELYEKTAQAHRNLSYKPTSSSIQLITNFCFTCNFGINAVQKEKIDFFAKNDFKKYEFYFKLNTNTLNMTMSQNIRGCVDPFLEFYRSYRVIDPLQDYKPMRKPYFQSSSLIQRYGNWELVKRKRRMIVRDWFFYFIWFFRVRKAFLMQHCKNDYHSTFSAYNDFLKYLELSKIQSAREPANSQPPEQKEEEKPNLNPDNIQISLDFLTQIKSITAKFIGSTPKEFVQMNISDISNSLIFDEMKANIVTSIRSLNVMAFPNAKIKKSIYQGYIPQNQATINYENSHSEISQDIVLSEDRSMKKNLINRYNSNDCDSRLVVLNDVLDCLPGKTQNKPGLLNIFIEKNKERDYTKEKKSKELSDFIKQCNFKKKPVIVRNTTSTNNLVNNIKPKINNSIHEDASKDETIPLPLFEIDDFGQTAIKFTFIIIKTKDHKDPKEFTSSLSIKGNLNTIRVNIGAWNQDLLQNIYSIYVPNLNTPLKRFKGSFSIDAELEKLKTTIIEKIKQIQPVTKEIKAYVYDSQMKLMNSMFLEIESILRKKSFELNLNHGDFLLMGFENPEKPATYFKLKIPKSIISIVLNKFKANLKISDLECSYSSPGKLLTFLEELTLNRIKEVSKMIIIPAVKAQNRLQTADRLLEENKMNQQNNFKIGQNYQELNSDKNGAIMKILANNLNIFNKEQNSLIQPLTQITSNSVSEKNKIPKQKSGNEFIQEYPDTEQD